jgi:hypothetical protein
MRVNAHNDQSLWLLTGGWALYGDETLSQVAVQSRWIAHELSDALPVPMHWGRCSRTVTRSQEP